MKLTVCYLKLKNEITVLFVVLYRCEILSATKIGECSRRVSHNRELENVLWPKVQEVIWNK
jgi:hypothetical protein